MDQWPSFVEKGKPKVYVITLSEWTVNKIYWPKYYTMNPLISISWQNHIRIGSTLRAKAEYKLPYFPCCHCCISCLTLFFLSKTDTNVILLFKLWLVYLRHCSLFLWPWLRVYCRNQQYAKFQINRRLEKKKKREQNKIRTKPFVFLRK